MGESGTTRQLDGYRPFHALTCPARTSFGVDGHCTCGGLDEAVWNPGDEPQQKVADSETGPR
jgi:hypothetical protein